MARAVTDRAPVAILAAAHPPSGSSEQRIDGLAGEGMPERGLT